MKVAAGIDMLHVPYTGANNANIIGDLLANRVQVYFPAYPATLAALPTGKIKLLGVFFDRAHQAAARPADREGGAAQPHHGAVVVRLHGAGRPAGADRRAAAKRKSARRWRIRRFPGSSKRSASSRSAAPARRWRPAAQADRRAGEARQAGRHRAELGRVDARSRAARKTFVLIHGAWHGGWCWRRVADLLEAKGHKVFAPTLTGIGDRSHLLSKDIILDTHIADIVNLFKWEDIKDACLVAHSYGGWPSSGALEQIARPRVVDRLARRLQAGERPEGRRLRLRVQPQGDGGSDRQGRAGPRGAAAVGVRRQREGPGWVKSKLTDQPNGVAMQPIKLTGAREKIAKKTYIRAPTIRRRRSTRRWRSARPTRRWKTFETTTPATT